MVVAMKLTMIRLCCNICSVKTAVLHTQQSQKQVIGCFVRRYQETKFTIFCPLFKPLLDPRWAKLILHLVPYISLHPVIVVHFRQQNYL